MKNQEVIIKIAGYRIKLIFGENDKTHEKKGLKKEILKVCSGFIEDDKKENIKSNFTIKFTSQKTPLFFVDIKNRNKYIHYFKSKSNKKILSFYHISSKQFQIILMEVIQKLLINSGFMLHGSGSLINNKAWIFLGGEGVGKSTVIKMIKRRFSPLGDDSLIIKKEGNKFFLYQTPFIEKEWRIKKNFSRYEISKVFFINKSKKFRLEKIDSKTLIYHKLFKQFWFDWMDKNYLNNQVKTLGKFTKSFGDFYSLFFINKKNEFLKFLEKEGLL